VRGCCDSNARRGRGATVSQPSGVVCRLSLEVGDVPGDDDAHVHNHLDGDVNG